MKINNIQNTPHFGMAIKADTDARTLIKECLSVKDQKRFKQIIEQQKNLKPDIYLYTNHYYPRTLWDTFWNGSQGYDYLSIKVGKRKYKDKGFFSTPMKQILKAVKYVEQCNKKENIKIQ